MRQQLQRWLRYPLTLLLMMWFMMMIHIDHELMLLLSSNTTYPGGMQPLHPHREPRRRHDILPWRRNTPHGNIVRVREAILRATTLQNKNENTDTEKPAGNTMRMRARVTEDMATVAAAVQEKKNTKRTNNRNDEEDNTKWEKKERVLKKPARRKIWEKTTKVDARLKKILENIPDIYTDGARSPEGISQEMSANSEGVIVWVGGSRPPGGSELPEGKGEISRYGGTKVILEPKMPAGRIMKILTVKPQMLMEKIMLEEATVSQERKPEMLAEESNTHEDDKSRMPKERALTTQFKETELFVEGIPEVAVDKAKEQTEKTNTSLEGDAKMQVKGEETLAGEEPRIPEQEPRTPAEEEPTIQEQEPTTPAEEEPRTPEQEPRTPAKGGPKLDTEKEKLTTEGRNLSLKQESPKLNINANNPSPVRLKILQKTNKVVPYKISHETDKMEVSLTEEQIKNVRERIRQANKAQEVLNEQVFGPVLSNTTVLLVQVHKRLENLQYLVESMEAVRGISESLVIFSHDLWDPAINAFVRNITSFRVLQIFFPFSIQLHPRRFPGTDPRDCAWNATRFLSRQMCLGQPDIYGHYREAAVAQIKHHWWWKINRVFEGLHVTRESTGRVVFLEEDHYLAPDLLHVLQLLLQEKSLLCHQCQLISLGNYKKLNGPTFSKLVMTSDWQVSQYNLGYALDRATWGIIKSCQEFFCTFDDYNWDWTLFRLVQTCAKPKLAMLAVALSRVRHIGSCGTHIKKKTCDIKSEVKLVERYYQASAQWLFPTSFKVNGLYNTLSKHVKPNGGWSDHRDHQLCKDIANGIAGENTLLNVQLPDTVLVTKLPDAKKLVE